MPFEKGHKCSTADKRLVTSALRRAVAQNPEKLRLACLKVLDNAVEGNLPAFSVMADRLDGKAAQSITLAGDEDKPLYHKVERLIVDTTDKDS